MTVDPQALLERLADTVPDSLPPVARVVAAGRRVRRRRGAGAVVASAAAVAVVAVTLTLVSSSRPDAGPSTPSSPPTTAVHSVTAPPPGMTLDEAYAWARSLPRGPDADVVSVVGDHTLLEGTRRVDLGADQGVQLLGSLPDGWLARRWTIDADGNEQDARTGLLHPDGSFRAFDAVPRVRGFNGGWAISPDGTLVTVGTSVVDVATGHVRSDLAFPTGVRYVDSWGPAGVQYARSGDFTPMTWDPMTGATRAYPAEDTFVGPGLVESYGDNCATLSHLDPSGDTTEIGRFCGDGYGPIQPVAADGTLVTESGLVLDPSGAVLVDLDLPVPPPSDSLGGPVGPAFAWEGDGSLLVTFTRGSILDREMVTVRCTVVGTVSCERTNDVASHDGTPPLPLDG